MKSLIQALCCLAAILLWSFMPLADKGIRVYLVGDSTMSQKEVKAYPETGWGTPFTSFFDSSVTVDNRAKNGRSTRTFIEESLWTPILQNLKEGDYVFIQFGHNDEVSTKKSYTTEEEFQKNLIKYVAETRSRKAIPVLLTPAARRSFDAAGNVAGTHEVYSELVRNVARKEKVALIDLDQKSKALLQQMGVESSKLLFNQLVPGEHPNYPKGITDNTHFNELGARKMAQIVLAGIRELNLELAARIRKPSAN
jgi:lysophospholipase L1-like esterase